MIMMDSISSPGRGLGHHVVCLPCSPQSHITAMLKLAKVIYQKGYYITFVNTESSHKRILNSHRHQHPAGFNIHDHDDLPKGFRFLNIPDGIPNEATQDMVSLCRASKTSLPDSFCELIANLTAATASSSSSSGAVPPVSCIIADVFWSFTARPAADKFEIPLVLFCAVSPTSFLALKYYRAIKQDCLQHANKDKGERNETTWYLEDTPINCIPDVENLRLCDLPRPLGIMDPNDIVMHTAIEAVETAQKSAAIIFHSSEALENKVLNTLSSQYPHVYSIGPLQLLLDQIPADQDDLKHIRCNMWKEDAECVQWLNSREPKSVLYVSFGSIAFLTPEQLVEFTIGICNSNQPFLWIIKPDLSKGEVNSILPFEFTEETKDRSFLSCWCPQEDVLNHPSIGGFLTHCGWNSILEGICAGVPMLCWPCFGDQQTNCRLICGLWKIGLELSKDVKRDEVERLVRKLMEGEESEDMRKRASKLKKLVKETNAPSGSSSMNLNKLLEAISSKSLTPFHMKEDLQEE